MTRLVMLSLCPCHSSLALNLSCLWAELRQLHGVCASGPIDAGAVGVLRHDPRVAAASVGGHTDDREVTARLLGQHLRPVAAVQNGPLPLGSAIR